MGCFGPYKNTFGKFNRKINSTPVAPVTWGICENYFLSEMTPNPTCSRNLTSISGIKEQLRFEREVVAAEDMILVNKVPGNLAIANGISQID